MTRWLDVHADAIPSALRALPWVAWRAETRGEGKPTKVPYCVASPRAHASSTNPETWGTFDDAVTAYSCRELALDGIGVVLTREARVTCIDLDRVLDENGQFDVRAETIVDHADSWTEISPSGRGLHVFVRGAVPAALKGSQIEIYADARYIAITGHRWPGTPDDVRDAQAVLDVLQAGAQDRPRAAYTGPQTPPPDDLAGAVVAKLQAWGVSVARIKPWSDGFLVELVACPWADEHTTGSAGAAVIIHASGAYDFTCLHAHCGARTWRDFRAAMESPR